MHNPLVSPPFQHQFPQQIAPPLSARQKIHVSNLPLNVTMHQLQQAFQCYGTIIDIRIIRKTPTGINLQKIGLPLHISCYAFIAFADNESAEKAIKDGGFGDWTVKPQIDKLSKTRSRSRSRSKDRKRVQQNPQQPPPIFKYQDIFNTIVPEPKDLNIFWSGFMFRSKSHRVGVDAKCFDIEVLFSFTKPPFQMSAQIQVNYKGNFADAKKCANEAFKFLLCPSEPTQNMAFQEYIDYFREKNKIGVAQIGNGVLYLLPPCETTNSIQQIQNLELLALYSEDKRKSIDS